MVKLNSVTVQDVNQLANIDDARDCLRHGIKVFTVEREGKTLFFTGNATSVRWIAKELNSDARRFNPCNL